MDYDKLIEQLRWWAEHCDRTNYGCQVRTFLLDAATAIEALHAENAEMEKQLNEFSEFLCHMTGNLLSKTNYTAQAMISAAEDYQQRVCDNDCDLRADLARVTAERDAAVKKYEAEKEDFLDYALSGAQNAAPFCTNRHPDCVDKRGWCIAVKCHGFSRDKED